jgi:hypothetical protein
VRQQSRISKFLGVGFFACVAAMVAARAWTWSPPVVDPDPNFRIVKDERGYKAVEIKWIIGTVDNIQRIRLPWGYRSLLLGNGDGGQTIDNLHKPTHLTGAASEFWFEAILPDVAPHDHLDPQVFSRTGWPSSLRGSVSNGVNNTYPIWDRKRLMAAYAGTKRQHLYYGPERDFINNISRPGRFQLNRISPERFVLQPSVVADKTAKIGPPPYRDLWFDGETPETSSTLISCGSDERFDGKLDLEFTDNHLCIHYFAHDTLSAIVELSYRKYHLVRWRQTQDRVDKLLSSFVIHR